MRSISSAVVASAKSLGYRSDDAVPDGIDHFERAMRGVISIDVLGRNIHGEELRAHAAFFQRR